MTQFSRRNLMKLTLANVVALSATPALAAIEAPQRAVVRHNTASFRAVRWQQHFNHLRGGAIVCDTRSTTLHFWSEDETTQLTYPCSVPMSDSFSRLGRTEITLKRRNPTWIPTPNMRKRDPDLPAKIGPGPDNPMGTRALNLSWQYYRIHGIDNPEKIGRRASNGCFGLYNHHVETLFELVRVGTQVVVI